MEARLSAVQKRLLLVLAVSIVLAFVVRPQLENGRLRAAVSELTQLRHSFHRDQAERALRDQAEHRASVTPTDVASPGSKRAARIEVAEGVKAVRPISSVQLATLTDLGRFADRQGAVAVAIPDLSTLADSLAWRLARMQKLGAVQIRAIELVGADVADDDLERERSVAALRTESLAARAESEAAARKASSAERVVERRSHRSARSRREAAEDLREARQRADSRAATHAEVQARYDQAALRADRVRPLRSLTSTARAALARVTLSHGKEQLVLSMPVALKPSEVTAGPLPGVSFNAVHEAGLWSDVAQLAPDAALGAVQTKLSWHFRDLSLFGLPLSGNAILQLVPCIVPCLLFLLLTRMRRAAHAYNPFTTKVPSSLPRVGFKSRFFELVAVLLLPLVTMASASASLLLIDQPPIFPALGALCCLLLGGAAFAKLHELRELSSSIVRSHSIPPPL